MSVATIAAGSRGIPSAGKGLRSTHREAFWIGAGTVVVLVLTLL